MDIVRKRILIIYGVVIGTGLVYTLWIKLTGLSLPCLYYAITGFYCPGCGSSRMFIRLFNLQVREAFFSNPVVFILLILWNLIAIGCFFNKPSFFRNSKVLYGIFYGSITMLVIHGVFLNIL